MGARGRIRDDTDFWRTLTEIGPFVAAGIGEPIGDRAIGAVNNTRATRVLDSRHGVLILDKV
jgi:hypothetical protein